MSQRPVQNGFHLRGRRPSCLPSYLILNKLDIRQCTLVLISVYFFIGFGRACVAGSRLIWFADEKCADKMIIVIIPESHMAPLPFGHITLHQCGLSCRLLRCAVWTRVCVCDGSECSGKFSFFFYHLCCSGFCSVSNLLLICAYACLSVCFVPTEYECGQGTYMRISECSQSK